MVVDYKTGSLEDPKNLERYEQQCLFYAWLWPRCIGRTKGGLNSKLHAVCDGTGRPIILLLTEGQMSDHKGASLIFHARRPSHLPLHPASGKAPLTGAPSQNPV
jgi:hypothetical protein